MTDTWLFGEMQLDLSKSFKEIFDRAFDIAENCGYVVTQTGDRIEIYGEDCDDSMQITNVIYFVNGKVNMVLKLTSTSDGKQIGSKAVEIEAQ